MKYFTKEMYIGWQEDDSQPWHMIWGKVVRRYRRQLKRLASRLSVKAFRFFTEESLHDDDFVSLKVTDERGRRVREGGGYRNETGPTSVELQILSTKRDCLHLLKYRQVRKVVFDYPSDLPLSVHLWRNIGRWMYDELTAAGRDYLRHEVFFRSGASLLIEFKQFSRVRRGIAGRQEVC